MERVYIGRAATADPQQQLRGALQALAELRVAGWLQSPPYASDPLGPADQPRYVNAVVALETDLGRWRCSMPCSASNWRRAVNARPNAGARAPDRISCCSASD